MQADDSWGFPSMPAMIGPSNRGIFLQSGLQSAVCKDLNQPARGCILDAKRHWQLIGSLRHITTFFCRGITETYRAHATLCAVGSRAAAVSAAAWAARASSESGAPAQITRGLSSLLCWAHRQCTLHSPAHAVLNDKSMLALHALLSTGIVENTKHILNPTEMAKTLQLESALFI